MWTAGGLRLAPLYDLVSAAVYVPPLADPGLTTRLAMRIGGARMLHEVNRGAFRELAERAGLQGAAMLRRLDRVRAAVQASAGQLSARDEHQSEITATIVDGIERRARLLRAP